MGELYGNSVTKIVDGEEVLFEVIPVVDEEKFSVCATIAGEIFEDPEHKVIPEDKAKTFFAQMANNPLSVDIIRQKWVSIN